MVQYQSKRDEKGFHSHRSVHSSEQHAHCGLGCCLRGIRLLWSVCYISQFWWCPAIFAAEKHNMPHSLWYPLPENPSSLNHGAPKRLSPSPCQMKFDTSLFWKWWFIMLPLLSLKIIVMDPCFFILCDKSVKNILVFFVHYQISLGALNSFLLL